jgi:hypothetical protein
MTHLILTDYWMGRDKTHPGDLTDIIRSNASELLGRVNLLLSWAAKDGVWPGTDEVTGTPVASGWRPPGINARTKNAAKGSKHQAGCGIDLQDTPDRAMARWCLRNQDALTEIGLWMEDPQWTPSWVHLQSVPPGSARRVYVPSTNAPLIAKLPEQLTGRAVA